jgi:hypothetical protein
MDEQSIRFHFDRGDFQKWLTITIGDEELAQRIDNWKTLSIETLQEQLTVLVQKRIAELQLIE